MNKKRPNLDLMPWLKKQPRLEEEEEIKETHIKNQTREEKFNELKKIMPFINLPPTVIGHFNWLADDIHYSSGRSYKLKTNWHKTEAFAKCKNLIVINGGRIVSGGHLFTTVPDITKPISSEFNHKVKILIDFLDFNQHIKGPYITISHVDSVAQGFYYYRKCDRVFNSSYYNLFDFVCDMLKRKKDKKKFIPMELIQTFIKPFLI